MGNCCGCVAPRGRAPSVSTAAAIRHPARFVSQVAGSLIRVAGGILRDDKNHRPQEHSSGLSPAHVPQAGQQPWDEADALISSATQHVVTKAFVVKVSDGDTITVQYVNSAGLNVTSRVRVFAIDCPETSQNYGKEAGDVGRRLIYSTYVKLLVRGTDRYGRLIAEIVTSEGLNYGHEMLRAGAAWHYKAYDRTIELDALEQEARKFRRGLWAFARPQPPWVYRQKQRQRQKQSKAMSGR